MSEYQPSIIAFVCNWCSYAGADKAGGQRLEYPANVRLVRVMCSGRVSPQFVMDAFRKGADGVMVMGCHFGDCHYRNGNVKAYKRMEILKKMLPQFGIDRARLSLEWVAAGESERFQKVVTEMTETVKTLGPLQINGYVIEEVS